MDAPILGMPQYREFADAPALRQHIFDNVLAAAQTLPPVSNSRHTLELSDVAYEGPERFSAAEEKRAILERRSLRRRMRGTWTLRDNLTGQPLDQKRTTVAHVPYLTDSGTFVHKGVDWSLASQLRLRPGVFARIKDGGGIESHANLLPGTGLSHRYFLDPDSGVFYLNIGQAKMPLLPLLRTLGATEKQVQAAWGRDLWQANAAKDDPKVVDKLHQRLFRGRAESGSKHEAVAAAFRAMRFDPDVTARTLGAPYDHVDADSIIAATRKLLAVSRDEAEPDDRDHLAFQTLVGPEDLLAERLTKDSGGLRRKLLWRATNRGDLSGLPADTLTPQLYAALLHSGLGGAIEESNPMELRGQLVRATRMGDGGLSSTDAIPLEARSVQPSHLNFIDPIYSPESITAGVDSRLASGSVKGRNGTIYSRFVDPRTGATVLRTPQQVAGAVIAFPGELERDENSVAAMVGGKIRYVPRTKVDLIQSAAEQGYSLLGNLVPMKSAIRGQRASMASRMFPQALPLLEREAPLVQSAVPGTDESRSYEEEYGPHAGAVLSPADGVVASVTPDEVVVRTADGSVRRDLHNYRPLNRKTYLHNTPVVKPGDAVRAGDLLASSNYTDAAGTVAMGRNARVAYLPMRGGATHEDAVAISASFARKLASEHLFQHDVEFDDDQKRGKRPYVSSFPAKFSSKQLSTMDDDGVVRPGAVLHTGDPVVLLITQRPQSHNQVHRPHAPAYRDATVTWDHTDDGLVTDVVKTDDGFTVAVRSSMPTQVGDKLVGRQGDKGVISRIVPDDQMLHDAQGRPFEVVLTPMGVPTRGNPAQVVEAALGKAAAHRGRPYKVEDWRDRSLSAFSETELARHGLKDTEDVVDPDTGRKIRDVLTGNRFFMKLVHQSEPKSQGRSVGAYSSEGVPTRSSEEDASKRVGGLELSALLAHNVPAVLQDIKLIRGQRNDDYWLMLMAGKTPPPPRVPLVYEKFMAGLDAAGLHPIGRGERIQLVPRTDKHVDELVGDRDLTSAATVDWKEGLAEIPGGLFDPVKTGGHWGKKWSGIRLHEPMPSPAMEEPIRRLLGLTESQFRGVLSGEHELRGQRGPGALSAALSRIDLPAELAAARESVKFGKKTARDAAVRRLVHLEAADRMGIHPKEWLVGRVPVLPPIFRPITNMAGSDIRLVADPNILYKELWDANAVLKELAGSVDDVSQERLAVYDAMKAVAGLGDPIGVKTKATGVRGILKELLGSGGPKTGTFHRRLLGSAVDLVGRAVISPDDKLGLDEVGLPEDKAWVVYRPFVVRRLVRRGMSPFQAIRTVADRADAARVELVREMSERPVLVNRAPTWHRYGFMAFWPRLAAGSTLRVNPLSLPGFGADFDGDQENYQVPASAEAVREAVDRMLPSKNLITPKAFEVHQVPRHEYLIGNWIATSRADKKTPVRRFRSAADAMAAYWRGDINVDARVEVGA